MNAQGMLEQLLKQGLSMIEGKSPQPGTPRPQGGGDAGWGKFGAGAAAGGALGLLMGSKRGRRFGGKALKIGSVAALGVLAYKAYGAWQAQQQSQGQGGTAPAPVPTPAPAPRTVDLLPPPEAELHSRGMLKAMVAAARADGHLDERERQLVEAEIGRLGGDASWRHWLEDELRRPLDPADVASAATSQEMAAEMYLASLLVADDTSYMERAYLDELARRLQLPLGLKTELEKQAAAV
ncbi:MAG: tellurite resistance TerB family protein [Burkholderiales bacterium]|nr:tellurite resistance TerB family protein [Burkholderiales bacterium]